MPFKIKLAPTAAETQSLNRQVGTVARKSSHFKYHIPEGKIIEDLPTTSWLLPQMLLVMVHKTQLVKRTGAVLYSIYNMSSPIRQYTSVC